MSFSEAVGDLLGNANHEQNLLCFCVLIKLSSSSNGLVFLTIELTSLTSLSLRYERRLMMNMENKITNMHPIDMHKIKAINGNNLEFESIFNGCFCK
jgi:hypothetical protein